MSSYQVHLSFYLHLSFYTFALFICMFCYIVKRIFAIEAGDLLDSVNSPSGISRISEVSLCFSIVIIHKPLLSMFHFSCHKVIASGSRMPRHSCCEMHVIQCMTHFFCASLQSCRKLYQMGDWLPPLILICCSHLERWNHLTSDIIFSFIMTQNSYFRVKGCFFVLCSLFSLFKSLL